MTRHWRAGTPQAGSRGCLPLRPLQQRPPTPADTSGGDRGRDAGKASGETMVLRGESDARQDGFGGSLSGTPSENKGNRSCWKCAVNSNATTRQTGSRQKSVIRVSAFLRKSIPKTVVRHLAQTVVQLKGFEVDLSSERDARLVAKVGLKLLQLNHRLGN